MLKRLVFVFGYIPVALYLFLRWILLGREATTDMEDFERWGMKND